MGGGLVTQSRSTLTTPWTVAHQVPLPMGFSRQKYWSGLPFSSPGYLPDPGIEAGSPALQVGSLLSEPPWKPLHVQVAYQSGQFCYVLVLLDIYVTCSVVDHSVPLDILFRLL